MSKYFLTRYNIELELFKCVACFKYLYSCNVKQHNHCYIKLTDCLTNLVSPNLDNNK